MGENYNNEKFRELLIKAMGTDNQKEFAEKCGLSVVQLSRIMSKTRPQRPSKTTLQKISEVTGISVGEFMEACDYKDRDGQNYSAPELFARDFSNGAEDYMKNTRLSSSVGEFLEQVDKLYVGQEVKYVLGKSDWVYDQTIGGGEKACMVRADIYPRRDGSVVHQVYFAVFFSETIGGRTIITGVSFEPSVLAETKLLSDEFISALDKNRPGWRKLHLISSTRSTLSAEQRLLNAIFGNLNTPEFVYTFLGFGFYLSEMPSSMLSFIKAHKKTIEKNEELLARWEHILKSASSKQLPEWFSDKTNPLSYGALIKDVMSEETDIEFSFMCAEDDSSTAAVMFDTDNVNGLSTKILRSTVNPYAKELGVKKIGQVHITVLMHEDENEVYDVI